MAGKVTELSENTSPQLTDIIEIVDNPGGTPASQKVTLANIKALIAETYAPWMVEIIPMISPPVASTGTWVLVGFANENLLGPFVQSAAVSVYASNFYNSSGAQNDAVSWPVVLSAGTWTATFFVRKANNTGIITLNLDGVSAGTVDTYAAAAAYSQVSIADISVAAGGKKVMQILMATKHASSAAYYCEIFAISLRRTA